jgi:molybdopterin converting factor small subunit
MIEIHLYGRFRELVPGSHADEDTVLGLDYVPGETFGELVRRLGARTRDIGDCFVNGNLAKLSVVMKDEDRVGLFPFNMRLIDGGQDIKGHGCIEHDIEIDWY